MASKKELKPLIKQAEKCGWSVTRTRADHLKWVRPGGGMPYFSSSTPSDRRAITNIERDLARMGLNVAKAK